MEEVFRSLDLELPPGSYCTWPGVHCEQCHVTELRLEQPQDVSGQLSPELGCLHRLKKVDFGGAVALTGNMEALRNATLLEKLNLSHSQVEGDLEVFENHPKLQHLDLENIPVKGSINVFSHTKDLHVLRLTATLVEGSIDVFKQTPELQELSIENAPDVDGDMTDLPSGLQKLAITNSNVSGNFRWERVRGLKELRFEHLPRVEVRLKEDKWGMGQILSDLSRLILTDTNVFGRLEDFDKAWILLELQLRPLDRDQVTGNIEALASLRRLQVLSLEKMNNVQGNLKALQSFSLQTLHLAHTKVEGSITYLDTSEMKVLNLAHVDLTGELNSLNGTLRQMQVMNLLGTTVNGSLQVLEDAKDLRELNLGSTDVVGDIEVFKHMTELRVLDISETVIWGDIHAFQALPELREVHAWCSRVYGRVYGDISVFTNKTKLKVLSFGGSLVDGDIRALREVTGLEVVAFSLTEVLGDIRVFEHAVHLQEAWLAGTRISGNIKAFGNSRHLERVFLSRTNISGNIQAFESAHQLIQLGLQGTKVEGDIGIFRRMRRLKLLTLDKNPGVFGNFTTFYKMESLQTLGLEGCNITGSLYKVAASMHRLRALRISRTSITGKLSWLSSLRRLHELHAAGISITGDIRYLTCMAGVRVVDLSRTPVSGRISHEWLGKVQKLRSLDVSASHVTLLPSELELVRIQIPTKEQLLPALETLQVSGCPLSGKVEDLFGILARSTRISQISASGCNLTGTLWDPSSFRFDDVFGYTVKDSLLVLDVSNNSIQHVECLPRRAKVMLSHNNRPLKFSHGVLAEASDNKQELDLRGSRLASFDETHELWMQGKLNWTIAELSLKNGTGGYGCFGLDPASTTLLGFGPDLLPDEMCGCLPGFFGKGITCAPCNDTSYNSDFNRSSCTPCPAAEMRTEAGAKSRAACKCPKRREPVGDACGCAILLARGDGDVCVHCKELNLNCSEQGMVARNAPAVDGYARLEPRANHSFQCFPPAHRCNDSGLADQSCAQGYQGILCMDCVHDYFASSTGTCWPCQDSGAALSWRVGAAAVCIAAGIALAAAWIWYRPAGFTGGYLMELKQNAPVLLQTCQLWAVLSALSTSQQGTASGEQLRSLAKWEAELPELPVIAGLGFSLVDLQGIFDFQCMMDGAVVRYWKALLAPVLPLIFLILCGFFELVKRGSGISKGLLVLSIFFVGGASSCAKLASCQSYDAGGRSLGEFAFQELMPSLKCSQRLPEVDGIYLVTFFCYLIPIPAFLLYLFAKQHVALQPTKLLVSFSKETTSEGKELHFARIPSDSDSPLVELKDEMLERRMVAGAVAYSAVFLGDQVQVNLKNTTVMVKGQDSNRRSSDFSETLESFSSDVAELKRQSDALRCRAIAEMLMERCVLFERCELAPSHERDRVLSGARDMLMKYAACQNVWMEIVLKLVAMSLVSVVRSRDGLQLSLAVTLVMATLVVFLRPYAHAQVNNLQCCCFISLAIAALSFSLRVPALSRVSLILPFLVALGQVWLPESPEVRASRIWQELEPKLLDLRSTAAGITASAKTLSITVHQSKEGN